MHARHSMEGNRTYTCMHQAGKVELSVVVHARCLMGSSDTCAYTRQLSKQGGAGVWLHVTRLNAGITSLAIQLQLCFSDYSKHEVRRPKLVSIFCQRTFELKL